MASCLARWSWPASSRSESEPDGQAVGQAATRMTARHKPLFVVTAPDGSEVYRGTSLRVAERTALRCARDHLIDKVVRCTQDGQPLFTASHGPGIFWRAWAVRRVRVLL